MDVVQQLLAIPTSMEIVPADRRSLAQGLMGLINGVISIIALVTGEIYLEMRTTITRPSLLYKY